MPLYLGFNGVKKELKKLPVSIGGIVKQQKEVWAAEAGVKKKIFSSGIPIGTLPVGTEVNVLESGSPVPYVIVHQGNPDTSKYDDSCTGTWLLEKNIKDVGQWCAYDQTPTSFRTCKIRTFMNGQKLGRFSASLQSAIKTANIPCKDSQGEFVQPCKVFPPDIKELGFSGEGGYADNGSVLGYFSSGTNTQKVIKTKDGVPYDWYTRTLWQYTNPWDSVRIANNGFTLGNKGSFSYGYAAMFILPQTFSIGENLVM